MAKAKTVKMYWVNPLAEMVGGNPPMIFGRQGEKTKEGYLSVEILESQVKNEKQRLQPMLTEKEYKLFLEQQAAAKEAAEEDVDE